MLGQQWAGVGTDLKSPSAMCLFQSTLNFGDLFRLVQCVTTAPCSHSPIDGHCGGRVSPGADAWTQADITAFIGNTPLIKGSELEKERGTLGCEAGPSL